MKKEVLYAGLVLVLGFIFMFSGCAKKPVVQEDVSRAPQEAVVPETADDGELAKVSRIVSDEGTPDSARMSDRRGYFTVGDFIFYDVNFGFDRYNIQSEFREPLNRYAKWFQDNPQYTVLLEGHTCEIGTAEYNLALGERRSDSVRRYLIDMGVSPARIRTVSYGEEYPLDPGQSAEAYSKNRRVHFVVSLVK